MTLSIRFVVVLTLMAALRPGLTLAAEPAASVLVQIEPATRGTLPERVTAWGTVEPATSGSLSLSLPAEGRVVRILVTPGEAVRAGESLIEFQRSAAATSTYQQAQSALRLARQEQARIARLLGQQLATRDQQAQADKAVADTEASLRALEQESGGRSQQVVIAPFDGVVSSIPVAPGDRVQPGAALAVLTRRNGLVVTAGIEPAQRGRVKAGQPVQLLPLSNGEPALEGSVSRIDHRLNPKTRLIDVDIITPAELLQGAAFRAVITTGMQTGWKLPRDAVLDDERGPCVYQVKEAKAMRVAVRRLMSDDATTLVEGSLDAALPVVTVGNYQLADGASVRFADSVKKTQPAP